DACIEGKLQQDAVCRLFKSLIVQIIDCRNFNAISTLFVTWKIQSSILPELPITETIDEMIVYHSNGLHVGIHHRRTNETESATLKVLAEHIGLDRSRGNLSHDLPPVKLWLSVNKTPAIGVEASKLFLDFEKRACVAHCGLDLHSVANDLRIQYELLDSPSRILRDFPGIKLIEGTPITFPLL